MICRTVLLSFFFLFCLANNQDWAQLGRYNLSDSLRSKLPPGTNQVIFLGDSITDFWSLGAYFQGKPYVNRGISGQTTPQMLVRLREDVIDLQPEVIVVLAGTNDISGKTGYESNDIIENNLQSITELSLAHNTTVILASILPVCGGVTKRRPPATILAINKWIQDYCMKTNLIYLDYFSAMVGPKGLMKDGLTFDCLHPTIAGYSVMTPLAEAAIDKALKQRHNYISTYKPVINKAGPTLRVQNH